MSDYNHPLEKKDLKLNTNVHNKNFQAGITLFGDDLVRFQNTPVLSEKIS